MFFSEEARCLCILIKYYILHRCIVVSQMLGKEAVYDYYFRCIYYISSCMQIIECVQRPKCPTFSNIYN